MAVNWKKILKTGSRSKWGRVECNLNINICLKLHQIKDMWARIMKLRSIVQYIFKLYPVKMKLIDKILCIQSGISWMQVSENMEFIEWRQTKCSDIGSYMWKSPWFIFYWWFCLLEQCRITQDCQILGKIHTRSNFILMGIYTITFDQSLVVQFPYDSWFSSINFN